VSTYLFDQAWRQEHDRLHALEAQFDDASAHHLARPDREQALARMVAAVRPGGWVVVEDVDFGEAMASALARYVHPRDHAGGYQRLLRGFEALFAAIGADASFGPRLPQALLDAGLEQVGAEVHAPSPAEGTRTSSTSASGRSTLSCSGSALPPKPTPTASCSSPPSRRSPTC
jgi:hypothetical protein